MALETSRFKLRATRSSIVWVPAAHGLTTSGGGPCENGSSDGGMFAAPLLAGGQNSVIDLFASSQPLVALGPTLCACPADAFFHVAEHSLLLGRSADRTPPCHRMQCARHIAMLATPTGARSRAIDFG
jgi:hypothetical protein